MSSSGARSQESGAPDTGTRVKIREETVPRRTSLVSEKPGILRSIKLSRTSRIFPEARHLGYGQDGGATRFKNSNSIIGPRCQHFDPFLAVWREVDVMAQVYA